jgi:hypothetical protein
MKPWKTVIVDGPEVLAEHDTLAEAQANMNEQREAGVKALAIPGSFMFNGKLWQDKEK